MTRCAHAATCIIPPIASSKGHYVWLSDVLLANVYERFTRTHIRHGSNVPGPLEARRRATRRKNTSWAYAGSPSPIDPTILFGAAQQSDWWQKPQVSATDSVEPVSTTRGALRAVENLVPEWLYRPFQVTVPTDPRRHGELHTGLLEPAENVDFRQKQRRLLVYLQQERARDIQVVWTAIKALNLNLRHDPRYSATIFKYMLRGHWPSSELSEFLCDPELSPPGSGNHKTLLAYLQKRPTSVKCWEDLHHSLCKAIQLGLVPVPEVQEILCMLPDVLISVEDVTIVRGLTEECDKETEAILNAIQESKVLNLEDLDLPSCYTSAAGGPLSTSSARLLWRFQQHSGKTAAELAVHLIDRWLRELPAASVEFHSFLRSLGVSLPISALTDVSEALVQHAQSDRVRFDTFDAWYHILSTQSALRQDFGFDHTEWRLSITQRHAMTEPLQISTLRQRVVIAAWTAIAMCNNHKLDRELLGNLRLEKLFIEFFRDAPKTSDESTVDMLGRIVDTLQALPLPKKDLIVQSLPYVTNDIVKPYCNNLEDLHTHLQKLVRREYSSLADETFWWYAARDYNDALIELAESVNSDLPRFGNTCFTMIQKNKSAFRVVIRLLKRNRAFRMALSRSWPKSSTYWPAGPLESEDSALRHVKKHVFTDINSYHDVADVSDSDQVKLKPQELVDLINHIATAFALTQVVDGPTAFRKVYWCFTFLHRHGAPIQPAMTRALWHAGVERFRLHGHTPARTAWILDRVREVEGEHVRAQLLYSPSFRLWRKELIEAAACEDTDADGPDHNSVSVQEVDQHAPKVQPAGESKQRRRQYYKSTWHPAAKRPSSGLRGGTAVSSAPSVDMDMDEGKSEVLDEAKSCV